MKRTALLLTLALLILPSIAIAGGACVLQSVGGNYIYQGQMLLKCTASSTDASMSHTFDGTHALDAKTMDLLDGRYITGALAYTIPADTNPKTDSDLAITDSDGLVLLGAAANGLNVVDDADARSFYFQGPDGATGYPRVSGKKYLTVAWSNNDVNSAISYLRLDVTGTRNAK